MAGVALVCYSDLSVEGGDIPAGALWDGNPNEIICNTLPHAGILPARFFPHTDRESFPILLVKFGSCIVQETGRGSEVEQFTRNEQLQF